VLDAKKIAQLLHTFLAKSDMLQNIHEEKLLQPITAYVKSRDILT